jgi:uncharacterized circularly permuted ATP-grasp superfamily protein
VSHHEAETVRAAIGRWHDLLEDADLAAASAERMEEGHRSRGMYFGDRPLCSVLRPRFLTHAQFRDIRTSIGVLMRAFASAYRRAMLDPAFRRQFGLLDWEEELVMEADPGSTSPSPTSRLDAFYTPETGRLLFTEYNGETPAGPAYMDELSEVMLALPAMGEFQRTHVATPLPSRAGVLHALLHAFWQFRGLRETPKIGILDWAEVPTYSEFVFFRDYFRAHGIPCEIADPREVEYTGGKLIAPGGFEITLIYKRVLIDELVLRMGMENPVVRAVRDGAVCMVNPFRCKVLYKKASFAVLSDERNAEVFDDEERATIDAHIPWTRVVEERATMKDGEAIDLVPWIAQNRERLVLKPNDDYGGRGIVLGWLVSDEDWWKAVQNALEHPYVVQERIVLPAEPFPSWVDGRVEVYDRMLDIAPFLSHGLDVNGTLSRLATDPLLNVTAGGGSSVCTFLVEPR